MRARPRRARGAAAAGPARGRPARGGALGRLRRARAPAGDARAGRRPRRLAAAGGRRLRAAARRGLPRRAARSGHVRRRRGRRRRRRRRSSTQPRPLAFDFFPGYPDLAAFPRRAWLRALRETLREAPDRALRLPRPARRAGAAARAGRAPAARARRRRRPETIVDLRRRRAGASRCWRGALAGCARSRSRTRGCRCTARSSPRRRHARRRCPSTARARAWTSCRRSPSAPGRLDVGARDAGAPVADRRGRCPPRRRAALLGVGGRARRRS